MKPADVSQEAWYAAIAAQDAAIQRCKAERLVYPFPTCNGKAVLDECVARAIMAAVAAEREACAAACAKESEEAKRNGLPHVAMGANWCTAAIRARSTP